MFTRMSWNNTAACAVGTVALVTLGLGLAGGGTAVVHAAPAARTRIAVWQQVGYAGLVSASVTAQLPVTFRLYNGSDAMLHEETLTADIRQGRFQVFVGAGGDLSGVLKDSRQMKVFFQGNLIDTVAVIHASHDDVIGNAKQFSRPHTVVIMDGPAGAAAAPAALAGTCNLVQSGFFTVPFTNVITATSCGGCFNSVQVSCGYQFLTTPSEGVIPYGVYPHNVSEWQVNYQVGATQPTLQVYGLCCQ